MSISNSLDNLINPWCEIRRGQRWVISENREFSVKPKNLIEENETSTLAKCYELMKDKLENFRIEHKNHFEYQNTDLASLQKLKKIVLKKYERYCKAHCLLWRILEIFLGVFRGYSYKSSCRKLIAEIENHVELAKKVLKQNHWQRLTCPTDAFRNILSYLPGKEIAVAERVCSNWKKTIDQEYWQDYQKRLLREKGVSIAFKDALGEFNPYKSVYQTQMIGPFDWLEHYGKVENVPDLPANIGEILEAPCPLKQGKKVRETHMLVLISHLFKGIKTCMFSLDNRVDSQGKRDSLFTARFTPCTHWKSTLRNSYWILMTKDQVYDDKEQKAADYSDFANRFQGYELPNVIEATVVFGIDDEKRYKNANHKTLDGTFCEQQDEGQNLYIGYQIISNPPKSGIDLVVGDGFISYAYLPGVMGVRRLGDAELEIDENELNDVSDVDEDQLNADNDIDLIGNDI